MGLKEVVVLRIARRWIAGVDMEAAIKDARRANKRGFGAVVNFLGEEIKDPQMAEDDMKEYLRLQQAISDNKVRGCASIKLTQFGLGSDEPGTRRRLAAVAANAEKVGQSLWLDMESSAFTDKTISLYEEVLERHKRAGLALQSYMRRSESDLKTLLDKGARVRLVKGAYREKPELIFPTRREVRERYRALLRVLFDRGDNFAVATHDSKMVQEAMRLAESRHVDFEFEMLKGIRNELKDELVSSGYKVSEYLPYGDQWFAYSQRRMSEHPSNIWLLLRSLV